MFSKLRPSRRRTFTTFPSWRRQIASCPCFSGKRRRVRHKSVRASRGQLRPRVTMPATAPRSSKRSAKHTAPRTARTYTPSDKNRSSRRCQMLPRLSRRSKCPRSFSMSYSSSWSLSRRVMPRQQTQQPRQLLASPRQILPSVESPRSTCTRVPISNNQLNCRRRTSKTKPSCLHLRTNTKCLRTKCNKIKVDPSICAISTAFATSRSRRSLRSLRMNEPALL